MKEEVPQRQEFVEVAAAIRRLKRVTVSSLYSQRQQSHMKQAMVNDKSISAQGVGAVGGLLSCALADRTGKPIERLQYASKASECSCVSLVVYC